MTPTVSLAFLALTLCHHVSADSYIPKVVFGTPTSMEVILLEAEIDAVRQRPVYKIEFTVEDGNGDTDSSIVHRCSC